MGITNQPGESVSPERRKPSVEPESISVREIDQRVRVILAEERALLSSTIGLAVKITGGAIALVLAVLGFVGWQNVGDLRTTVQESARKEMEKFLTDSAPKELEEKLDDIRVRALVSFYLQSINSSDEELDEYVELTLADAEKLVALVRQEETDDVLFSQAIEVLKNETDAGWWRRVEMKLGALATAKHDEWLRGLPDRWGAIVDVLAKAESKRAFPQLKGLLVATDVPGEVQASIMRYAYVLHEPYELEQLISLHRGMSSEARDQVLKFIAYEQPSATLLKDRLAAARSDNLSEAISILVGLADGNEDKSDSEPQEQAVHRSELQKACLSRLALLGMRFGSLTTNEDDEILMRPYSAAVPFGTERLEKVALGGVSGPLTALLDSSIQKGSVDELANYVGMVSRRSSIPRIFANATKTRVTVSAEFNENSGFKSDKGKEFRGSALPNSRVQLQAATRRVDGVAKPKTILLASWQPQSASEPPVVQTVATFLDPKGVSLSISASEDIDIGP